MDIPERIAAWMAAPDNDEKLAVALEIAGEIDIGSTDILPVLIRGLGPYLTDEATLLEVQNGLSFSARLRKSKTLTWISSRITRTNHLSARDSHYSRPA